MSSVLCLTVTNTRQGRIIDDQAGKRARKKESAQERERARAQIPLATLMTLITLKFWIFHRKQREPCPKFGDERERCGSWRTRETLLQKDRVVA